MKPLQIDPSSLSQALQINNPSSEDEIMFVIYSCQTIHEFRAFDKSGKEIHQLSFTIDIADTELPMYSGFGVLGSTLYMIGGDTIITATDGHIRQVPSLDTYQINLNNVPSFPQNLLVTAFAKKGPSLNAEKMFPIVVVVRSKIYIFSNYLSSQYSPNFEVLDADREVQEWIGLPEPPFDEPPSKIRLGGYVKVEYYFVDEDESGINVCLSYNAYSWVCRLDLCSHQWTVLSSGISPSFYGKVVSVAGVNYALNNDHIKPDGRLCHFSDIVTPDVQEVAGQKPSPKAVSCYHLSEIGFMGDTLFHARIGSKSMRNRNRSIERKQDCYVTIDVFQIREEGARRKAVNFRRKICSLGDIGFIFGCRTLQCVSWAPRSRSTTKD